MWDDPLFNPGADEFLELAKDDPGWAVEKRREMNLHSLDLVFRRVEEAQSRFWYLLYRVQPHLAPDVLEQIKIDLQVNDMDSDFSYVTAVREMEIEPGRPKPEYRPQP